MLGILGMQNFFSPEAQGARIKKVKRRNLCSSLYPWLYEKNWRLPGDLLLRRKPGRNRSNGANVAFQDLTLHVVGSL